MIDIEKAASVAGYVYKGKAGDFHYVYDPIIEQEKTWNPYLNPADAFDLMVKANIQVREYTNRGVTGCEGYSNLADNNPWKSQEKRWMSVIVQIAACKYDCGDYYEAEQ